MLSQIASDLSGFSAKPFKQNHSCSLNKQHSKHLIDSDRLAGDNDMNSWVSSAYCWCRTPEELIMWPTGDVNIEKRSGPRTEPWGIQVDREVFADWESPTTTRCTRPVKYELIQPIALSDTPQLAWSLDRSMWWSVVSKAALKSRDNKYCGLAGVSSGIDLIKSVQKWCFCGVKLAVGRL